MKKRTIWTAVSVLLVLGLVVGVFGCAAQTAPTTTAPAPTTKPAPSPSPSLSPTPAPKPSPSPSPTLPPTPAQAQVIKWTGQAGYAKDVRGSGVCQVFAPANVSKYTGGRLVLDIKEPVTLVPSAETFSAVKNGVIDMAYLYYPPFHQGLMPEVAVVNLPFAWDTIQDMYQAYNVYGLRKEFEALYAANNIKWFPVIVPVVYILGGNKPYAKPDDVKGQKLRASGAMAELVTMVGGSPVNVSPSETYMALKLGTIDGGYLGVFWSETAKLYEVIKYINMGMNSGCIGGDFIINMDKWKALPEDVRLATEAAIEVTNAQYAFTQTEVSVLTKFCIDHNIQQVYFSPEDRAKVVQQAIDTVWTKVAKYTPTSARMVDMVRKQAKDLGLLK